MSNFAFLPARFSTIADAAGTAEARINDDPRGACFHARFALEAIVHWLYRHDPALRMPYSRKLGALIYEPTFQDLLPEAVYQKVTLIQKQGNQAVHERRQVERYDALQTVKELHHLCYWLVRTYAPDHTREGAAWSDGRIPIPSGSNSPKTSRAALQQLEANLAARNAEVLKAQQEKDALDGDVQRLREELARVRAASQQKPDPHDYSEADTRTYLIDVELRRAGWPLDQERDREYQVTGMPNTKGVGYADYVLWGDDGKPLGVVEAKKSTVDPEVGRQQAKLYADSLAQMHGRRPVIFTTNGYRHTIWDDTAYPPRRIAGFYKKDELERLILRRTQRVALDVAEIRPTIADRSYQKRAIGSIAQRFTEARRTALLVMATGTGKTRTAIALVDLLQRAGWVKRALFLADRVSLVKQAVSAFKAHLPDSSPVNLVTEKSTQGRVYVCTYPTMMGLIDESDGGTARFGVGHFDIIVIDEAHRSVYQKYGAIFRYFDALLVGLTATPREQVDRNTYELFGLEPGVPTDAYELEKAVFDGYLVPPKVQQVDLKFPRSGISYDDLSEEEKEEWESLDWGDDDQTGPPDTVSAAAINQWLFNRDTVDKVLMHLMENGVRVDGRDRLGKTIIFARNHDHAVFIEERFNHHYPHYTGQFARVIDNRQKYPQSLIDDFSIPGNAPHIAISVDMMDTGIDVPEVVNLVFFKPVYSRIKFWQMIGRGTRLRPDLFGPDMPKTVFRVFDFCFNFDFFREHPDGLEANGGPPLGARIFQARVSLVRQLQGDGGGVDEATVGAETVRAKAIEELRKTVMAMNRDNFIVRMHLDDVDHFRQDSSWDHIDDDARRRLVKVVATLPSEREAEQIETRLFDLALLKMQIAYVSGEATEYETIRRRIVKISESLAEKTTIPAVKAEIDLIRLVQTVEYWDAMTLETLEELRTRLRLLTPFVDKGKRPILYTNFEDQVLGVREEDPVYMPSMTGEQYEKKVKAYLEEHKDDMVIARFRQGIPLTESDLESLQATLISIGEDNGKDLLGGLLERTGSTSLVVLVRRMIGMDRDAVNTLFSEFISDNRLSPQQIRFVEMIVDHLAANGAVEPGALYEPPFTSVHSGGPDELFSGKPAVVEGIFHVIDHLDDGVQTG
jgi:type I restriction enzyme, R subunit